MKSRRTSNGLQVIRFEPPAGPTYAPAAPHHRLAIHVGRPVRARCRCDGHAHYGLQSRGDIDLVPAGLDGVWEDDRATQILLLNVSTELIASAAVGFGLDPARVELVPQFQLRDPQLEHIAWAFEAELESSAGPEWLYGESLAMALAVRLIQQYGNRPREIANRLGLPSAYLRRLTEYIEENLHRPLTLAQLASTGDLGVSQFKTRFKRSTGMPVHQFVVRRRVERARALLSQGKSTISEVALRTGFSDPSHLARWMRRVLGVTPRAVLNAGR